MNRQNSIFERFLQWLHDPFGRKTIREKHQPILEEMHQISATANTILRDYDQGFPISRIAGNPRLRRRHPYVQSH